MQWQGPYHSDGKPYYHHLPTNKTCWENPFQNNNYCAEIIVKLLQNFGSRADVLETTNGFAKRNEVLRKHRSFLEHELGGPMSEQELAYLYSGQSSGSGGAGASFSEGYYDSYAQYSRRQYSRSPARGGYVDPTYYEASPSRLGRSCGEDRSVSRGPQRRQNRSSSRSKAEWFHQDHRVLQRCGSRNGRRDRSGSRGPLVRSSSRDSVPSVLQLPDATKYGYRGPSAERSGVRGASPAPADLMRRSRE